MIWKCAHLDSQCSYITLYSEPKSCFQKCIAALTGIKPKQKAEWDIVEYHEEDLSAGVEMSSFKIQLSYIDEKSSWIGWDFTYLN